MQKNKCKYFLKVCKKIKGECVQNVKKRCVQNTFKKRCVQNTFKKYAKKIKCEKELNVKKRKRCVKKRCVQAKKIKCEKELNVV